MASFFARFKNPAFYVMSFNRLRAALSGQITMASRRKVKNGQKLKKGSFFPIKNLVVEMAPIGMIQETRKKN